MPGDDAALKYDKTKVRKTTNKPKGARGYSSSSSDKSNSIVSSSSGESSKLSGSKTKPSSSLSHNSQASDTSSYEALELTPRRKPTKAKKATTSHATAAAPSDSNHSNTNSKRHSGSSSSPTRSTTGDKQVLASSNPKFGTSPSFIVSGNYVVHEPGNPSGGRGNPSKPEKKRRSSHRHTAELSHRSIQNVLSKDLLLFVFSFLNVREISSLAITCRFFLCLIDRFLDRFGEVGTFIKIEARHSLFFRFDTLIEELLTEFPSIVIHCEIGEPREDDSSNSDWPDSTFVNSERFELQSLTPQTRAYEKARLKNHIKSLIRPEAKDAPKHFDISTQSWFLDFDRKTVEQILERQADYTFCIRSSSVAHSYVLSYKNGKPFHSLIVPWKKWYFSGTITDDFIVHGLFFTSVAYLVWYWRKMGLGHRWMPLNYRHSS